MKQQLQERLAALHINIDETVAERHLAYVADELKNPAAPSRYQQPRRIKMGALVSATLLVLLPGAAFAADGAVPGDSLYPIKLAFERVLALVDRNIEAEHRIEELEILVDRAVPYEELFDGLQEADRSVQDRDVPNDLLDRLDVVRGRVANEYGPDRDIPPLRDRSGEPGDGDRPPADDNSGQPRPSTTTAVPPETDRPPPPEFTTTSTPLRGDGRESEIATTTEPPRDRDNPPRDG
jgi:hypothetical protein